VAVGFLSTVGINSAVTVAASSTRRFGLSKVTLASKASKMSISSSGLASRIAGRRSGTASIRASMSAGRAVVGGWLSSCRSAFWALNRWAVRSSILRLAAATIGWSGSSCSSLDQVADVPFAPD
jgi:hypothetical protein